MEERSGGAKRSLHGRGVGSKKVGWDEEDEECVGFTSTTTSNKTCAFLSLFRTSLRKTIIELVYKKLLWQQETRSKFYRNLSMGIIYRLNLIKGATPLA